MSIEGIGELSAVAAVTVMVGFFLAIRVWTHLHNKESNESSSLAVLADVPLIVTIILIGTFAMCLEALNRILHIVS